MHISEDRRFFWDGSSWKPLYSPDGRHRWDGAGWVPVQAVPTPPPPPAGPAPHQPDHPSWLPAEVDLPRPHQAPPPVRPAAQAAPAAPLPAYGQPVYGTRQTLGGGEAFLFSRMPVVGAAVFLIAVLALGVLAVGKLRPAEEVTPVLVAADTKLTYEIGVVERWHVHENDHGVVTLPNAQKLDSRSDADATYAMRIISVGEDGSFTVGFKYETLTGFDDDQPIFFNAQKAREIVLVIRPDGSIVSGGTNGTAGGKATESVPGGDQNWSIMPDHDVKAGEEWEKSFDRPNPLGSGTMHYRVRSKFVRYDDVFGVKAAVIETRYTLPIDVVIDLHALLAIYGDDAPDFPGGTTITYKGKEVGDLITKVDVEKHRVINAKVVNDADFEMVFQGLPDTPKFAPLKGKWHYAGRDIGDMQKLS